MTETAFLQYTGYVLAFFAVWIVARCARSMLSERYVPEVWGYLELPDGTSRAIEHWECILGRAKASDIVLTGEGIERSHAAIQRSGAGEWTLSALDGGRGVWLNGKAVTGDAPLRGGDTLKLGEMELHFLALDDAQRATLQRKRPLTGHKVQPAVTLLLLVCFQLVLLFQFFFTTDGAALAYIVLSFGLLIAMEWFCYFVMRSISVRGFEPETLAFFLTSVGFSVAGSSAPDSMGRHCLLFLAALALFFALGVWLRDLLGAFSVLGWGRTFVVTGVLLRTCSAIGVRVARFALGFLALNLLLSETIWGAKNWRSIAGQTLQPSEFVKIAYVYAGAATLDRLFRRRNLILFIAFSAVCVGALALMGDFGTALVFFVCFLVISFMRSGSFATLFLAIGGAALAVMLVLTVKPYVAQRFATWGHAWDDPLNTGFQQVRTMSATAAGGLFGRGAGAGWLKNIFAANTDMVFGVVCEELGLIVALCCVLSLLLLAVFSVRSAAAGRSSYYVIASCATVTIFMAQLALNVFGSLDLLPFTGVTFPFVSKGGSSLISCWGMLAYIKAGDTRSGGSFALRTSFENARRGKKKKEAVK